MTRFIYDYVTDINVTLNLNLKLFQLIYCSSLSYEKTLIITVKLHTFNFKYIAF